MRVKLTELVFFFQRVILLADFSALFFYITKLVYYKTILSVSFSKKEIDFSNDGLARFLP